LQLALNNLEYEWQGTDEVEERFLNVIWIKQNQRFLTFLWWQTFKG
jgi:hypothetical protein